MFANSVLSTYVKITCGTGREFENGKRHRNRTVEAFSCKTPVLNQTGLDWRVITELLDVSSIQVQFSVLLCMCLCCSSVRCVWQCRVELQRVITSSATTLLRTWWWTRRSQLGHVLCVTDQPTSANSILMGQLVSLLLLFLAMHLGDELLTGFLPYNTFIYLLPC